MGPRLISDTQANQAEENHDDVEVYTKLLDNSDSEDNSTNKKGWKIWPYLVWLSVFLTKISAAGFNYGIAGSITEVQTRRFDVSLSKSSLTASVHSAVFLGSGKLITFLPALNKLHPILFSLSWFT